MEDISDLHYNYHHHHKNQHQHSNNNIHLHHHHHPVDASKIPETLIGHHLDSHLHLLEPLTTTSTTTTTTSVDKKKNFNQQNSDNLLPFIPSLSASPSSSSSSSSDPQLLPTSMDGSSLSLSLSSKGLKFEEEPADSFIVRSKSAILRCKTLNALNAWFTCNSGKFVYRRVFFICFIYYICFFFFYSFFNSNSYLLSLGDERKIQNNQKLNNYVDPEKGIRMVSDLCFFCCFFS